MNVQPASILALLELPGVGTAAVRRAVAAARAVGIPLEELLGRPVRELIEILPTGLHHAADDLARCGSVERERADRLLDRASGIGAQPVAFTDGDYPSALTAWLGPEAPPLLFVSGDLALLAGPSAGIVGTRRPSARGKRLAAACAETVCDAGMIVVSGGAAGVDSAAHETAVARGGRTVVVLPQGVLTYHGPAFIEEALDEGRAAIVSEFVPEADWQTHAAVTRNATISALLSRMVCVIEPRAVGGSIRTARCALEQGKHVAVYVEPGLDEVAALLRRTNVHDLLDGDSRFDSETLRRLLHSDPESTPIQQELF